MPCNSDYLNPDSREIEMSKVACLIDEINGLTFTKEEWNGHHPSVYRKVSNKKKDDSWVACLCSHLKKTDVTKYSLEMQIWWRDHQAADKAREEKERQEEERRKKVDAVLAKLTPEERRLIGRR